MINSNPIWITIFLSTEDNGYICKIPEYPNLSTFGETPEEALKEGLIAYKLLRK